MKLCFSKSVGRLRVKSLPFLTGLLLSPLVAMATDSIYQNTGFIIYAPGYSGNTVLNLPQVDATTFVNSGTWDIVTVKPYQTANTLNYTNEGSMVGEVGWEFDYGPLPIPAGGRGMSANFFNDIGATIQAIDLSLPNPYGLGQLTSYPVSYLWISATNVVNKGHLIGDSGGEIRLTGSSVNLARSTLEINAFSRGFSYNNFNLTNFISVTGVYDEYWGQTNTLPPPNGTVPYAMASSTIWNGTSFASPVFYVSTLCGVSNVPTSIPGMGRLTASLADSTNIFAAYTNIAYTNHNLSTGMVTLPSKIFRQAVFVHITDPNIIASNRFLPTGDVSNLFQIATVRLTNSASGEEFYLVDTLGALTNRGLLLNTNYFIGSNPRTPCTDPTYRPANYTFPAPPDSFANGSPGVGKPAATFLYTPPPPTTGSFTNDIVQATYAGYSAYIDNLIRRPFGDAVTNLPGRIIINADSLDLTRTTIANRGAEVVIQANHLISSTGAVVSCQNLSYNLGSTNGTLNVTPNLASQSCLGFNGTVDAFSALWTNGMATVIPSWTSNTTTTLIDSTPLTNFAEMDFHVLLVDASGLSSTVPVTVQDLILNATNMVVSDPMTVVQTLLFGSTNNVPYSLNLQSNLNLSGNLQNWTYVNAPHLRYFTNNGVLSIPQDAHFGDDGPTNYASFVNNGIITAGGGETIDSDYFQNSGTLYALGGVFVTTSTGLVTNNASIISGQDVDFSGGTLKLTHATIAAGNHLYFNLTNALYDAGPASGNTLICTNGFSLLSMPTGSATLMGTTIRSVALNGAEVDHVWAAVDRGNTQAGFSGNVVICKLVLTTNLGSSSEPLFVFSGASANNGLYVSNLDLSGLADFANEIQVNPNLVIYYISVTGPTPLQLTTAFGSRFIQAAGGIIPSIGNPPSGPSPKFTANYVVGSGQIQFTVNDGVAGQTYTVEASTNLPAGNWVPIFTTTAPLDGLFQFVVPEDVSSYPNRFYRVVTSP